MPADSFQGFLAVAYVDGSLYVVDMRGPNIILRHGKSKSRHSMVIGMGSETDVATCLRWTICPTETGMIVSRTVDIKSV